MNIPVSEPQASIPMNIPVSVPVGGGAGEGGSDSARDMARALGSVGDVSKSSINSEKIEES